MKLLLVILSFFMSFAKGLPQVPKTAKMVTINGKTVYYEVYGRGRPLFLLHGFTQSSKSWHPFVSDYENDFTVYLVDLKGHGQSGPFTEKLSIRAAAADLDGLVRHLKLDSIDAIGFSYGGDILFQLALLRPGLIRSMISIGACGSWNAHDFPQWIEYLSYKNLENLPWMKEEQKSEEQIRSILDQLPNYVVSVSGEEMKTIRSRVLFVLGDQDDSIPLACIETARKNLPHSSLWIVPNTGHSAHKGANKAEFVRYSKEFFQSVPGQ
jgi:pimeloyl-ACP methyl ester carboxylesterase